LTSREEVIAMRQYVITNIDREELKRKIASSALDNTPLPITATERLDELTARRRLSRTVDLLLEIDSIHLRDGGFVIAREVTSDAFARIEFTSDAITLTVTDSTEVNTASS